MSVSVWRRYWNDLDWIRELSYLTILAMEACMIYPWQLLISSLLGYEEMSIWGLYVLLWVSYLVASLLNHTELTPDRRQMIVAGLLILSAFLTIRVYIYGSYSFWSVNWIGEMANRLFGAFSQIPPDLIAITVVFIGWWRGIVVGRKEYDTPQVWFHFRVGIIVLFGYFLVTLFGQRVDLSVLVFAYFFFGLMSIALARILELGGIHQSTLGSKQWIAVLIGSTVGSLGLALLVSLFFSRQAVRTVLDWFRPLQRFLLRVFFVFAWFVFYLAWPLVEWARLLIAQMRDRQAPPYESLFASPMRSPIEFLEFKEITNAVPACNAIVTVLIIAVGLLLVVGAIRRLSQQEDENKRVERESLLSSADLAGDLRNSLREGWNQIVALASQFEGRHQRSAASIRKIYASMVDLATEAGYPRRPAETPYEYRSTLYQAFAGGGVAVEAITEAYVRVHYGELPGTQAEMDRIVRYWQQVQKLVLPRVQDET